MANDRANVATGVGVVGSIALLATPAAPLALPALAVFVVARICRKMKDDEIDRQERIKEREQVRTRDVDMSYYPITPIRSGTDLIPYSSFPVVTSSPETEIAHFNPRLAAKVLLQQSQDQLLASLANSSVATEFARQGRGTFAAARRRKHFFGGESTEIIIRPVD